jgi:hypothetical protein
VTTIRANQGQTLLTVSETGLLVSIPIDRQSRAPSDSGISSNGTLVTKMLLMSEGVASV